MTSFSFIKKYRAALGLAVCLLCSSCWMECLDPSFACSIRLDNGTDLDLYYTQTNDTCTPENWNIKPLHQLKGSVLGNPGSEYRNGPDILRLFYKPFLLILHSDRSIAACWDMRITSEQADYRWADTSSWCTETIVDSVANCTGMHFTEYIHTFTLMPSDLR